MPQVKLTPIVKKMSKPEPSLLNTYGSWSPFWKHTCTAKHQAWAFDTTIDNSEDGQEIWLMVNPFMNFAIAHKSLPFALTMLCLKNYTQ
jgi:hypothetical protein